jgi:D-alanyl-D-alanine carboxypeptidase/D-alanyl-D-alanine-endopeptidase (penicillin-binding protein 4)
LFVLPNVPFPSSPTARRRAGAIALAAAAAFCAAPPAHAAGPDLPFKTPVARGGQAQTAVSASNLAGGLARQLRRSGGRGGAWVGDPVTGETLFASGASRRLRLASNMKLFTTATALARIGPNEQFETRLVAAGPFVNGVVQGDLIVQGGGDPSLTGQGLARLAEQARGEGLTKVTGRLLYDETFFDRKRAVRQPGISGGPFDELGRLSGLSYESGRSADPARSAALAMVSILRKRGVSLSQSTAAGEGADAPAADQLVAEVTSSSLRTLARSTNTFSINFYAEMLLKGIAAEVRGRGTTRGGIAVVKQFAAEAGATTLKAVNGSGLARTDIASPRSVGALLGHMLEQDEPVRDAFLDSLAVAGGSGTLARRMRGTAAQGNCIGKTGTLTGVSALSGYCEVAPDRFVAFSILMNRVDVGRAHVAQDRMTALIARYTP